MPDHESDQELFDNLMTEAVEAPPEGETTPSPDEAEEAPQQEGASEETTPLTAEGRSRDPETGRFVVQEEDPDWVPEKFRGKSKEEVLRSYLDLESKLGQRQEQDEEPPQPLSMSESQEAVFLERAAENPVAYADWARRNNQAYLYEQVMDTWYVDDPKTASRYEMGLHALGQQNYVNQVLAQQTQPIAQDYENRQTAQAVVNIAKRHGVDAEGVAGVIANVIEQRPYFGLAMQDPAKREAVMEDAFLFGRASSGQQAPQASQAPASPPAQARPEAFVASASNSNAQSGSDRERALMDYFLAPDPREITVNRTE